MDDTGIILDGIIKKYSSQLTQYYFLLRKVMPEYFFKTFSAEQLEEIFPLFLALESDSGVQRSERAGRIIHVYLKSEKNNLPESSRLMRGNRIAGAVIHESKEQVTINGRTGTLVIECFTLSDGGRSSRKAIFKFNEISETYHKRYGDVPSRLEEFYSRLNWEQISDLSLDRLVERMHLAISVQDKDYVSVDFERDGENKYRMLLACPGDAHRDGFFFKIIDAVNLSKLNIERAYWRELSQGVDDAEFSRQAVTIASFYLSGEMTAETILKLTKTLKVIYWTSFDDLFYRELVVKHHFNPDDVNLIRAAAEFVHSQFAFVDNSAYNAQDIHRLLAIYPMQLKGLIKLFELRFDPSVKRSSDMENSERQKLEKAIRNINSGVRQKDVLSTNIFLAALNFINNIQKTNFYVEDKSTLAFRMDPGFMKFYEGVSASYRTAFPSDCPFGVFFFFRQWASGFQVRFAEIARGGWRTVIPRRGLSELEEFDQYDSARDEIFREVFVLAHTQHMKNKDIYEGGAKMITLLNMPRESDVQSTLWEAQKSIAAAFVSLINYGPDGKLRDPRIVDYLGGKEIIEIGPDENMFDQMIEYLGSYAEKVGYTLGAGLISGKHDRGINHKEFGVTSFGVHQYLLRTLGELGINPVKDAFSVKISGGPYGDVAGNEMKLLLAKDGGKHLYPNLKIVAITDGPAAVYDPAGIDREMLSDLVLKQSLDAFSTEKLKGDGAYIIFSKPVQEKGVEHYRQLIRKGGKLVEMKLSRDEFSRIFQNNIYIYADVFIPCGGRPSTINASNYLEYLPDGKPSSKAIVEGANSFITPDARIKLQDAGILIVKDASANKCGVITSSYEILSGLMLDEAEFMAVKGELVPQVMDILARHARRESEWLFAQRKAMGRHLTELTDMLSREINAKNVAISEYLGTHPEMISDKIILSHLPPIFAERYPDRLQRIPTEYRKAIVAVELATRIIYSQVATLDVEIRNALG
jgi:glutamate dehydrogenase